MDGIRLAMDCALLIAWPTVGLGQLYEEDLNVDPAASWTVKHPALFDTIADFFYDYSLIGVPVAFNGAGTRGLKSTANK